jgi:hypothetical protein
MKTVQIVPEQTQKSEEVAESGEWRLPPGDAGGGSQEKR